MKKFISRFRVCLPVILFMGLLLIPELGFAQKDLATTQGSDALKSLADVSGMLIELLTFLALLMLNFFGDLLGTEMITGQASMAAITPMWRWIRDLTNILFVGVLLFLAFSNLFSSFGIGGEGGSWTIKEKLPKLIIAMIAINFSLLGFKVVIDAINVGTVAIFGIADTKLEPDMSGLNKNLTTSRTWMKIDGDQKKNIVTSSLYEKVKDDASNVEVKNGGDCGPQWTEFINDPVYKADCAAEEKQSKCALITEKKGVNEYFVCRGFRESINDIFCRKWVTFNEETLNEQAEVESKCVFMIKDSFDTILTPKTEPGQNLFAAFGSVFMHLERLPALGAKVNNLNDVVMNTIFSVILALAFIVALVAVFIALIARLIVLWVALVFSPLLVGASILGLDAGKGKDISDKILTHLIMPLKIAAAFAVGFIMMSAMVEWHGGSAENSFVFGAALSQLGQDEYSFLWQIATIVLFWLAAFWAIEKNLASFITEKVQAGAELLATTTAKTLTVDRPLFTLPVGDKEATFSLGTLMAAPQLKSNYEERKKDEEKEKFKTLMGWNRKTEFEKDMKEFDLEKNAESLKTMLTAGNLPQVLTSIKNGAVAAKMREVGFSNDYIKQLKDIKDVEGINTLLSQVSGSKTFKLKSTDFGNGTGEVISPEGGEKKEQIKGGASSEDGNVIVAPSTDGTNNITYTDVKDGSVTKSLESALKSNLSLDDLDQIAAKLSTQPNIVYTPEEKRLLQNTEGTDGNKLWTRLMKSESAGLFPGMSGDGTALEVEVINPEVEGDNQQITLKIDAAGKVTGSDGEKVESEVLDTFKSINQNQDLTAEMITGLKDKIPKTK